MTEHSYTLEDLERLADLLAPRIAERMPQHVCPFDKGQVSTLTAIAVAAQTAKRTSWLAAVGALTVGALTLIGAGLVSWLKREMGH